MTREGYVGVGWGKAVWGPRCAWCQGFHPCYPLMIVLIFSTVCLYCFHFRITMATGEPDIVCRLKGLISDGSFSGINGLQTLAAVLIHGGTAKEWVPNPVEGVWPGTQKFIDSLNFCTGVLQL